MLFGYRELYFKEALQVYTSGSWTLRLAGCSLSRRKYKVTSSSRRVCVPIHVTRSIWKTTGGQLQLTTAILTMDVQKERATHVPGTYPTMKKAYYAEHTQRQHGDFNRGHG